MINTALKIQKNQKTFEKIKQLQAIVSNELEEDIWDMKDPFFAKFQNNSIKSLTKRFLDFSVFPDNSIKLEMKYWCFDRFQNGCASTALARTVLFKSFNDFIKNKYPKINSLAELDIEKTLMDWVSFLKSLGKKTSTTKSNAPISNIRNLLEFVHDFYDTRDELDKDVWDFRKINFANFNEASTGNSLYFTTFKQAYRESIKRYFKSKIINLTYGTLWRKYSFLKTFFNWIEEYKPDWLNLKQLTRTDVMQFVLFLNKKGYKTGKTYNDNVSTVGDFIDFLQRTKDPIAPSTDVKYLIFPEDFKSRKDRDLEANIKFIPDFVLNQLKDILDKKPEDLVPPMPEDEKKFIPVVIVMMASGMRISDVLNIRYDNCLVHHNGWFLQADIVKIKTKEHKIPIDDSIAMLIQMLAEETKRQSNNQNNPKKYLFPVLKGRRQGMPFERDRSRKILNNWAKRYKITDEKGEIYHFKNHAFRHTKGVELINSGMSIIHVQKWLAHVSPEMTVTYAKILDDSLRKEWLATRDDSSIVRVDFTKGDVKPVTSDDLIEWEYIRHNLEAAKVPMGFCMASKKLACPFVETPCLTCNNFCTTPEMLPEFQSEINKTQDLIAITKDMPIYNEKNVRYLEKLSTIVDTLSKGQIHHVGGKNARQIPQ